MRTYLHILFLLLVPIPHLEAQNPSEAVLGKIEGLLINQVTGQPISKGRITLSTSDTYRVGQPATKRPSTARSSTSNEEGKFTIELIEPGFYKLTADRPGFIPGTYRAAGSSLLQILPKDSVTVIRFGITPYAVIEGQVVDEDGSPTTEFQITALRATRSSGRWSYIATGTAFKVDDMGRFRIANLLPGRFKLVAVPTRRVVPAEKVATYVSTFYPSTLFIADAEAISVAGGQEARATIRLRKERVFNVQGKVIDAATGATLSGFLLILNPTQGNHSGSITPNAPVSSVRDGAFYFKDVLPGSYTIEPSNMVMIVNGSSRLESKSFGHHSVMVKDQDLSEVVVPLHAGVTVRGKLTHQAEEKLPFTKQVVRLSAVSSLGRDFSANVSPDGAFEILTVAPEQYRVHVLNLPEGSYHKTASSGDQDVTSTPLDLTGGVGTTLAITISPKSAALTGSVHWGNGSIAADVLVTLAPIEAVRISDPLTSRKAKTDVNGQFVFKSLPPGEYRILAWENIDDELAMDPEIRSAFDAQSARVKLSEGSNPHLDLRNPISEDSAKFEASKIR